MSDQFARPIHIPFKADSIASPEIRYGVGESETGQTTCLVVWISDETEHVGRVTFEGFDSIRCCRGEYIPYRQEGHEDEASDFPWVFEVENSQWLTERHEYESRHYDTPLLDEYVHYLFSFHDEFVELIAKGVWFEKVTYEQVAHVPTEHPLLDISMEVEAEEFSVAGICCEVRRNPQTNSEILEHSKLCSQMLFQYFLKTDGETRASYAALVRTIRGETKTRLRGGLFYPDQMQVDGIADEPSFRPAFTKYVEEVAERRRKMGKS